MKKTKPVKGSARAKKFDAGGLAALAGLGALAYMMRKKKGDESKGSVPTDTSDYSSSRADVRKMIEGSRDEESRTPSATKFGGESNLGAAITESGTRPGPDTTEPKLERKTAPVAKKPVAKPVAKSVVKAAEKTVSGGSAPKDTSGYAPPARSVASMIEGKGTAEPIKKSEGTKKRGGIGPYHAFEGVTDYVSKLREGRKRPGETQVAGMKRGGAVKASKMGAVKQAKPSMGSASKRADGIAQRGKTRGRVL
jgi:hypothetical protein